MTLLGRVIFPRLVVVSLVGLGGELVKHHAQGKAYAHPGRNILHARPEGKAQEHTYGDVAGEAWTFLFLVVHKLQSISWFLGTLPNCGLGCTAIKE